MEDTLFSFETLATLGGAAFLVFVVVGYTKKYVQKLLKLPTDLYAVLLGTGVLFLAQVGLGANAKDWRIGFLALCNGFLVALAAGKMNDKAVKSYIENGGGTGG